jgi:hypothetical protein
MAALNLALSFLRNITVGAEMSGKHRVLMYSFGKKRYVGIGFLEMRLIPYINIVYGRICLKNSLIIDNEAY